MAFDPNTPAGNATEDTWASVAEAYQMLPRPLAIETIILAHVALTHRIVENIADKVRPKIMHMEARGFASMAADWFSMALLKMVQVVQGDRKRKSKQKWRHTGLRRVGEKYGWDDWTAPGHMAKYLGKAVKNEVWRSYAREGLAHKRTLAYLLKRHSYPKAGRIKRG